MRHNLSRGIGTTLRARWLASQRAGGARRGGRVAIARSRVPDRATPMLRAPSIAVGLGERSAPVALAPVRLASLGPLPALGRPEPAVPAIACAGEAVRIRNYAGKIVDGIAASSTDDLKLFDDQGRPTPNLAHVMANMATAYVAGTETFLRELLAQPEVASAVANESRA